jgi:hypothetical protein
MAGPRPDDAPRGAAGVGGAGARTRPARSGRHDAAAAVERTFRAEGGGAIATLTRLLGDLTAA